MLIDSRKLASNHNVQTDVCVIGAGACGISIAKELSGESFKVCLLESGGFESDKETDSLKTGEVVGNKYSIDHTRARYFGGTTNLWNGQCRPFEDIDFEKRDWVPYSGWPFSKNDLMPFYKRAQSICHLGPMEYYQTKFIEDKIEKASLKFKENSIETIMHQSISEEYRKFGVVYREDIIKSPNIDTYLYANVVELETRPAQQNIHRVRVACLAGNEFHVSAKIFILATGGIENARLLLLSNKTHKRGLGNRYDLVGRFFADHASLLGGFILAGKRDTDFDFYRYHEVNGIRVFPYLSPSESMLRAKKLRNVGLYTFAVDQSVEKTRRWIESHQSFLDFTVNVKRVISDIDHSVANLDMEKVRNVSGKNMLGFLAHWEVEPNPQHRVMLSHVRDKLGQNKALIKFDITNSDRDNLNRFFHALGIEVGRGRLGRLQNYADTALSEGEYQLTSHHHMGTTRMHSNPEYGVVDSNSKVHGISNLYIAGGSVFPVASSINPTLTIIALSIRLADHIKGVMV